MKIYVYTFADGFRVWCRGMSKSEIKAEEREHGKLIDKREER